MHQLTKTEQSGCVPKDEEICRLSDFFKVLGDPTRIRILFRLFDAEISVAQLAEDLGMSASAVSHQLKVLRVNGLIRRRRDGKFGFYRLADDHVCSIIAQTLSFRARDEIE